MKPLAACVVVAMALSAVAGCKKKEDTQPPVATATFAASRAKAPLGSPLDLTYRFVVAANAPAFDKDYRVLVHFHTGLKACEEKRPHIIGHYDCRG